MTESRLTGALRGLLPYAGLALLMVALGLLSDRFLTPENLGDVARRVSVINVIAVGMTFVILTGGIDLSVGSITALAGVAGTWALTHGLPVPLGVALGALTGAACGLVNGLLVGVLRLPPFVATLGTMGAFLAGIPTGFVLASVYVLCGACAGLAGMIDAARILTGNPAGGGEYELRVIAAVVLGGAALTGGEGTVAGATIGALLMAVLENGCNLLGISPFIQRIVIGTLIVAVVALDVLRQRGAWRRAA